MLRPESFRSDPTVSGARTSKASCSSEGFSHFLEFDSKCGAAWGRYLAVVLGICLLAVACSTGSPPSERVMGEAAMQELYLKRFASLKDLSSKNGLGRYDPLESVPGDTDWQPLPVRVAPQRRSGATALVVMRDYAELNRSSSLLVWVDGAVEGEFYFGDTTRESLIVSKSLAKPLGAIAVGRAMQQGFIDSLDQAAADFIPAWRDTEKANITLRHLLGQRSGLLPQGRSSGPEDVLSRAYLHPAHDEVIINEYPLTHPPGSRYEYSNANSELVAPIVEAATGVEYEEWVSREVLAAIGAMGGEVWMNRRGGTAHSGCCMLLPAESYLRLAVLLLNDGVWEGERLLPEGYVAAMRSPSEQNPHAGLGVYLGQPYIERRGAANPEVEYGRTLHSEPYLADDLFLFDGNSNQVAYIVPSQKMVILRTGAWAPAEPEWDNARLPNLLLSDLMDR